MNISRTKLFWGKIFGFWIGENIPEYLKRNKGSFFLRKWGQHGQNQPLPRIELN